MALPKHNQTFWRGKFSANVNRDKEKNRELRKEGWKVITLWECKIKKQATWKEQLLEYLQPIQKG
jgi:DNA mismatch endonuclease (patch repair protein)